MVLQMCFIHLVYLPSRNPCLLASSFPSYKAGCSFLPSPKEGILRRRILFPPKATLLLCPPRRGLLPGSHLFQNFLILPCLATLLDGPMIRFSSHVISPSSLPFFMVCRLWQSSLLMEEEEEEEGGGNLGIGAAATGTLPSNIAPGSNFWRVMKTLIRSKVQGLSSLLRVVVALKIFLGEGGGNKINACCAHKLFPLSSQKIPFPPIFRESAGKKCFFATYFSLSRVPTSDKMEKEEEENGASFSVAKSS